MELAPLLRDGPVINFQQPPKYRRKCLPSTFRFHSLGSGVDRKLVPGQLLTKDPAEQELGRIGFYPLGRKVRKERGVFGTGKNDCVVREVASFALGKQGKLEGKEECVNKKRQTARPTKPKG